LNKAAGAADAAAGVFPGIRLYGAKVRVTRRFL